MENNHEFDYEICNSRLRPLADELVKKYEELRHVDVDKILFVVNHKSGGSKKRVILARTRKVPDKWRDLFFQLGACSYAYIIEIFEKTTASFDENQIVALLYREMRMIAPEGGIVTPDTNDWWQVLMGLGRHWFYPDSTCPNLLDKNIDWTKLMGAHYEPPKVSE